MTRQPFPWVPVLGCAFGALLYALSAAPEHSITLSVVLVVLFVASGWWMVRHPYPSPGVSSVVNLVTIGSFLIKILPYIEEGIQFAEQLHDASHETKRDTAIAHAVARGADEQAPPGMNAQQLATDLAVKTIDKIFEGQREVQAAQAAK